MRVSDYVAAFLRGHGITSVFELSGGMIVHLLDAIHRAGEVRIVSMHHEQGAAFAADAFGRMTGLPGVAMATSGPGATNLLTGIGSAYFDSSPAIFITGQVNRNEQKGDRGIRQLGFQETDIVAVARPLTKAAFAVRDANAVPHVLAQAFDIATTGRPGPVLVDIPMDVQREQIDPAVQRPFAEGRFGGTVVAGASSAFAARMLHALKDARRPLILAGGGIRSAHAVTGFRKLVRRLRVPVVHSLMAIDVLPYDDPLRVGMIGSYGNRWANHALGDCDVMVVLGSRLDIRQTGADTRAFKGERAIFHVDCEPGELNNRVTGCETLTAGLDEFLRAALDAASGYDAPANAAWSSRIAENRARWPDTEELAALEGINPNAFIHALSAAADPHTAAFVVDVGQHQMWAAQSLELRADQRFLTSGGMGSMGFALPAAIGAAFTAPGRPIVAIAGDGGFQCNIQELETVARNRLPLKIVVLDNGCHGMVRQFQETYFEERYQSTVWGYSAPDFVRVAQAYGIAAASVEEPAGMDAAVRRLWADPHEPMLLRVAIPQLANAYPKLAFGRPITEMEPFAQPIAMEST